MAIFSVRPYVPLPSLFGQQVAEAYRLFVAANADHSNLMVLESDFRFGTPSN